MTLKLYQTAIKMMPQPRKKQRDGLGYLTGQNTPESNFFCQQNLTKTNTSVENNTNSINKNMKLGESGSRMAMLGGALAAGLAAGAPEQAKAQDFASYCEPLASGEVLQSELTPQNMSYIFDENGQVIGTRADELTQYYGDGISEACDAGDIGAYVSQYGGRVMLEIYPPGQYPLGVAPDTMRAIQARYQACINENLVAVDDNGNGVIDANEDREFYEFMEAPCNEELQADLQHEGRMAALAARQNAAEERIAELDAEQAKIYAQIQARTEAIIEGARREIGL